MTTNGDLAAGLARAAGEALLALRAGIGDGEYEPAALKDAGDQAAQRVLAAALAEHAGGDAVLSEEAKDVGERSSAETVWIIDPLDGTREFSERADGVWRDDWAVHVARWRRGAGLVGGAVALPARGQVFSTEDVAPAPAPAWPLGRPLRLAVSRSRPPALLSAVADLLSVEFVPMGSAGVKAMAVVTGRVDAYLHDGGQYEWDSAAPVAVARAAGLHTSRIDGSELEYNGADPWLPDLLICPPALAGPLLAAVREARVKEDRA
ncbi:MAG: inositol monophosphatase family protein [Microbacteriaceae bacterium]